MICRGFSLVANVLTVRHFEQKHLLSALNVNVNLFSELDLVVYYLSAQRVIEDFSPMTGLLVVYFLLGLGFLNNLAGIFQKHTLIIYNITRTNMLSD